MHSKNFQGWYIYVFILLLEEDIISLIIFYLISNITEYLYINKNKLSAVNWYSISLQKIC